MDEALRLQKERDRIHRWRASKRQAGNDMLTIWLPRELKLYIEDMALKRHCSPSDLIQQALATGYPLSANDTDTVTDTHMQIQDVTAAALETPLVTDTVTDTPTPAEAPAEPPAPRKPPRQRTRQAAPAH